MANVNLNYLQHNFVEFNKNTRFGPLLNYKCKKCYCVIWFSNHRHPTNDSVRYYLYNELGKDTGELKITCEEYIIKNILE